MQGQPPSKSLDVFFLELCRVMRFDQVLLVLKSHFHALKAGDKAENRADDQGLGNVLSCKGESQGIGAGRAGDCGMDRAEESNGPSGVRHGCHFV
eukprot:CAMPEP_0168744966 /NCGR_PEP_ID=MMETSP0724-20121128/14368_1 /TAXON_ID=265536 /ORGANISM="Amphiprora sp., Strain CCMP467" /LENGTH=94 /DNA_ID=CAMNT_0008792651 /DNA_START=324 /DNA_END=608 /DNA_ORIENTATION=+